MLNVDVRLFNSLHRFAGNRPFFSLSLPAGARVSDALHQLPVPESEIFLALHNGHNIMCGFGLESGIEYDRRLTDGDVLAFSGPVPFSRGYGSPVV